jgi:hypothetical protein
MFRWAANHHQGHKTYQKKEGKTLWRAIIIRLKVTSLSIYKNVKTVLLKSKTPLVS